MVFYGSFFAALATRFHSANFFPASTRPGFFLGTFDKNCSGTSGAADASAFSTMLCMIRGKFLQVLSQLLCKILVQVLGQVPL